jgi:hypothetical protein
MAGRSAVGIARSMVANAMAKDFAQASLARNIGGRFLITFGKPAAIRR